MKLIGRSVITSKIIEIIVIDGFIKDINPVSDEGNYPYISPGFFDIQVNGYMGINYSLDTLTENDLIEMVKILKKSGTTKHLPTIITAPGDRIEKNLRTMASVLDKRPDLEHAVPGFHIEGPYISEKEGVRGAHDPSYIRDPDIDEFIGWQKASGGRIKIITLAPERKGALEFIRKVSLTGVVVSLGHTAASGDLIHQAVEAGAVLSTHLGNGSESMLPRLRNYLWEQLACDGLVSSIIADGYHLPPAVIKTFYRTKGPERLILISDVSPLGGLDPGRYSWDNMEVEVSPDGHVGLAGTPYLAGAGHLLDHDIAWFMSATGCSIAEAVALCTVNPAKLLLEGNATYSFKIGARADCVVFRYEKNQNKIKIEQVFC